MSGNLGQSSLRRRRRPGDPLAAFDGLPAPLRRWLSDAVLPWSPASARRIWFRSIASGLTPEETLLWLSRAEAKTLNRNKSTTKISP